MLYQPTNIIPSSFAGVGGDLIDATDGMTISWQINGTSPMLGYKITIYRNNDPSTQLYTTGDVMLDSPFYGVDGMGNIQRFSVTLSAATLSGAGIENGYSRGYKYKITQYWSPGYAFGVYTLEQTMENFFMAQDTPTAAISTTTIAGPTSTLAGTYAQEQGVSLDWVRWVIAADGQAVEDSGKINTQELSYTYNGFLDDTAYTITMEYQAQNGYHGSVSKTITTSWTLGTTSVVLHPTSTDGCTGVILNRPVLSIGKISGQSPGWTVGTNGILSCTTDGTVTWGKWHEQTGDESASIVWRGRITGSSSKQGNVTIQIPDDDGIKNRYNIGTVANETRLLFTYSRYNGSTRVDYYETYTDLWQGSEFTMVVSPPFVLLFASGTLYQTIPVSAMVSGGYTPTMADDADVTMEITASSTAGAFVECRLFGILRDKVSQTGDVPAAAIAYSFEQPEFTSEWIYLSDWAANGLSDIGNVTSGVYGAQYSDADMAYYRVNENTGIQKKITVLNPSPSVIDFGVATGGRYRYFAVGEATGTGGTSDALFLVEMDGENPVSPCFWNWIVDTGVWDDERGAYEYTGSYIFALNVETDSFDNGNNPNLLQNFTRYPTRQGTNQNYLSGQLTGYIGHIDRENNVYIDTAAEAEAIRALSTSTDTKFLRSRKGERWMIDTSGPIRLTLGDKYKEQPYTASIPWVEVGDASDAHLISLPGDAAWPLD